MISLEARSVRELDDWELDWTDVITTTSGTVDPIDSVLDVSFSPVTSPPRSEVAASRSLTNTTTVHWITGGVPGVKYLMKVLVRTEGGREREVTLLAPTKKADE